MKVATSDFFLLLLQIVGGSYEVHGLNVYSRSGAAGLAVGRVTGKGNKIHIISAGGTVTGKFAGGVVGVLDDGAEVEIIIDHSDVKVEGEVAGGAVALASSGSSYDMTVDNFEPTVTGEDAGLLIGRIGDTADVNSMESQRSTGESKADAQEDIGNISPASYTLLFHELKDIGNWDILCTNLGVKSAILEGIRYDTIDPVLKKKNCLKAYIDSGKARWDEVVRVVCNNPFYNVILGQELSTKYGVPETECSMAYNSN